MVEPPAPLKEPHARLRCHHVDGVWPCPYEATATSPASALDSLNAHRAYAHAAGLDSRV